MLMIIVCDTVKKKLQGKYFHKGLIVHDNSGVRNFYKKYDDKNSLIEMNVLFNDNNNKHKVSNNITEKYIYTSFDSISKYEYSKSTVKKTLGKKELTVKTNIFYGNEYKYNDDNKKIEDYRLYNDERFLNSQWVYDKEGKLVQKKDYYKDSIPQAIRYFQYNTDNNISTITDSLGFNNGRPWLLRKQTYIYKNGKLKEKKITDSGREKHGKGFSHYDERGNITQEVFKGLIHNYTKTFKYNKNNQLIHFTSNKNWVSSYQYNPKGLITSESNSSINGKKIEKEIIKYSYIYF